MKIDFGTGRIGEINDALKKTHQVEDVSELAEEIKLSALLHALKLDLDDFDSIIAENSPVFRTVKGHAFETVFKYLIEEYAKDIRHVGGDQEVDLIVNGKTLQLKTPYVAGTKKGIIQYKTHKTHGAKSESESMDYYHSIRHFPDFLVGLISYDPFRVLFLNHAEIPRHSKDSGKILSPFSIRWEDHPGLNSFERIGVQGLDMKSQRHVPGDYKAEKLKKSSQKLNLKSELIIDTILADGNFRIWDMSIRGFAKEVVVQKVFRSYGIETENPVPLKPERGDKADLAVKVGSEYRFIQVKGMSTSNCKFTGEDSVVATETQLTRGRVNNHPTQSRLYLNSDFDFLFLVLDPPQVRLFEAQIGNPDNYAWKVFCIPTDELKNHSEMPHRLSSLQRFKYADLLKFEINKRAIKQFFIN